MSPEGSAPPEPGDDRESGHEQAPSPSPRGASPVAGVAPRKPRYLLVALIFALLFGAGCWTEGCGRLGFYRGEHDQAQALNAAIKSDTDRARADALYQRYTEVADGARGRAIPMAAAMFVLGAALLALAARGLAGKTNTRSALVQVVAAQAVVVVASYFLTKDLRNAELDWEMERTLIHQHETLPPEQYEQVVPMMTSMRAVIVPGWLVLRTIASGLILVALTRQRSREFFDAAGRTVPER
ncbi:MAG: hypothetical protein JWP97_292 [Labilithrix sp.]|nr:hypothetical protein [Labilithrix sp.]